jgi:hypothetical protein
LLINIAESGKFVLLHWRKSKKNWSASASSFNRFFPMNVSIFQHFSLKDGFVEVSHNIIFVVRKIKEAAEQLLSTQKKTKWKTMTPAGTGRKFSLPFYIYFKTFIFREKVT